MLRSILIGTMVCLAAASAHAQMALPERKPVVCEDHVLQTGIASVYANMFNGNRTASGETFSQTAFTAAHPTLPFNTLLRVKDRVTGRTVMVRINDRGPYAAGRIIDLSSAARKALGHSRSGIYKVSLSRCDGGT